MVPSLTDDDDERERLVDWNRTFGELAGIAVISSTQFQAYPPFAVSLSQTMMMRENDRNIRYKH
jgi:hypothetical protein